MRYPDGRPPSAILYTVHAYAQGTTSSVMHWGVLVYEYEPFRLTSTASSRTSYTLQSPRGTDRGPFLPSPAATSLTAQPIYCDKFISSSVSTPTTGARTPSRSAPAIHSHTSNDTTAIRFSCHGMPSLLAARVQSRPAATAPSGRTDHYLDPYK